MQRMVNIFDINGTTLPILDTLKSNACVPVVQKQQMFSELQPELYDQMQSGAIYSIDDYLHTLSEENRVSYNSIVACDISRSQQIEKRTRLQSRNNFWFQERIHRITSSTFGTFYKLRPTRDPIKTFIQKKSQFVSSSVQHYEGIALAKYVEQNPCTESSVGLTVNPSIPFLGASPDLLIKENGELKLVEVKRPYSIYNRKESINTQLSKGNFFLEKSVNGVGLKPNHDYFYQIQGQLNLTGVKECKLVVFVPPEDVVIVTVKRDRAFFDTCMLPKLCSIWFNNLFPYFLKDM